MKEFIEALVHSEIPPCEIPHSKLHFVIFLENTGRCYDISLWKDGADNDTAGFREFSSLTELLTHTHTRSLGQGQGHPTAVRGPLDTFQAFVFPEEEAFIQTALQALEEQSSETLSLIKTNLSRVASELSGDTKE